jgi:general secretion pathway protein J
MTNKERNAGFTLIEVMLAMTLLSIMVTLLFASLKICAESWNKGEVKIAEVNEKAVVYQFFKRHLPSIRPLWDDFSGDERQFSFQGEPDKLQFVSIFPASSGRKGLQIFEIVFDKTDEGQVKVMLNPFYPAIEEQQWEEEEVILLEHVERFEISYFGKEDGDIVEDDNEGVWADQWMEKEYLPALIKINIELENNSFWPEMIFALKLSATEAGAPTFKLEGR